MVNGGAANNVAANEIAATSPFARAILGRRVAETVEDLAPAGVRTVQMLDVRIDP